MSAKFNCIRVFGILISVLLIFTIQPGSAQKVEVLQLTRDKLLKSATRFEFIEVKLDTQFLQHVATIKAVMKDDKRVLFPLFSAIKKEANQFGANSFKINSFSKSDSSGETVLILDCYYAYDLTLATNAALHEKNIVYIFGKEMEDGGKTFSVNVNGRSEKIEAGQYLRCEIVKGRELKINKGGFAGESYRFTCEPDQWPAFFSLYGIKPSSISQQIGVVNGVPIISFNPGGFVKIPDDQFGFLLINFSVHKSITRLLTLIL